MSLFYAQAISFVIYFTGNWRSVMLRAILVSIVALGMLAATATADPLAGLLAQCELESENVNLGQTKPP